MSNLDAIILALATWRITSLLYIEDGPYLIFVHLRRRVGVYYDAASQRHGSNEIAKAINCSACLSVWIGLGLALSYIIIPAWAWLPFALSAIAIIIETLMGDTDGKS